MCRYAVSALPVTLRAVARDGARHLLVGRPHGRARRIQPRIELVSRRKRLAQRLRPGRTTDHARHQPGKRSRDRLRAARGEPASLCNSHVSPRFHAPDACTSPLPASASRRRTPLRGRGDDVYPFSSLPVSYFTTAAADRSIKHSRAAISHLRCQLSTPERSRKSIHNNRRSLGRGIRGRTRPSAQIRAMAAHPRRIPGGHRTPCRCAARPERGPGRLRRSR